MICHQLSFLVMWEKIVASLLTSLLPASILGSHPSSQPDLFLLDVYQPATKVSSVLPTLRSKAALVFDLDSSETLFAQNAEERLPPASLTKLMVALIVVENLNPDAIVQVSSAAAGSGGARMNLRTDERYTIASLLQGLLIPSGNDAAIALAEAVSGSEAEFVVLMNQRAKELGLSSTHFANTTGYDHPEHYSSALDMGRILSLVFQHPLLVDILRTPSVTVQDVDTTRSWELASTNDLLGTRYSETILAAKTGTTSQAGQCLIEVIQNSYGKRIAFIILGSTDRYTDVVELINWHTTAYRW